MGDSAREDSTSHALLVTSLVREEGGGGGERGGGKRFIRGGKNVIRDD